MWCFAQFSTMFIISSLKNTHGGALLLVKLQAKVCNFTKSNTPPWVFCTFLNCTNGTKLHKASQINFGIYDGNCGIYGALSLSRFTNVLNNTLLHPLKTSEKLMVFWCFQGVEKYNIGKTLVNVPGKGIQLSMGQCRILWSIFLKLTHHHQPIHSDENKNILSLRYFRKMIVLSIL